MKYAAMAVGMCFLFAFFSDRPSDNEVVPGLTQVGEETNLRGQRYEMHAVRVLCSISYAESIR